MRSLRLTFVGVGVIVALFASLPSAATDSAVGGFCTQGAECGQHGNSTCVDDGSGTCASIRRECNTVIGPGKCSINAKNGCGPGCKSAPDCTCPGGY